MHPDNSNTSNPSSGPSHPANPRINIQINFNPNLQQPLIGKKIDNLSYLPVGNIPLRKG